jgi:hypothetical protein
MTLLAAVLALATLAVDSAAPAPLEPARTIELPGVEGRVDHLVEDAAARRLYVAALGNGTIEVVDVDAGRRVGRIEGLEEPQGVVVLPTGTLVVTTGGEGAVRFYDAARKLVARVTGFDDADNVRFDPKSGLVYVGHGDGAIAVIDPVAHALQADIAFTGHPESFQLEQDGARIFVNVPSAKAVVVIDRDRSAVIGSWPLEGVSSNYPMALDERHHRLFVGCREPARLVVLDTHAGTVVASFDCCGDADDVWRDGTNRRIYVSGGEGCVTVIDEAEDGSLAIDRNVITAPGARTSLLAEDGRLYVAVPHRGKQAAAIRELVRPVARP